MKKIFSILSVALVAIFFTACSNNSPAGAVEEFFTNMKKGNYEKVVDLSYFKETPTPEQKQMLVDFVAQGAKMYEEMGGISSVKIDDCEISESGKTAEVTYTLTFGDGSTKSDTETVVNDEGKWKVKADK